MMSLAPSLFSSLMALLTFLPDPQQHSNDQKQHPSNKKKHIPQRNRKQRRAPSSWIQIKNLFTCKTRDIATKSHPHLPTAPQGQETSLLANHRSSSSSQPPPQSPVAGTARSRQFRKLQLSGCYECHAVVEPAAFRYPLPRTRINICPTCGEVFPNVSSLELHQTVRHAVCELGADDSSRKIVEIIFKSSWLTNKDSPYLRIERILKVHNTDRTIRRFEDYRDAVKARAVRNARCAADGNELLRFSCATLACSLGARGGSSLCGSSPACGVCTIIRHGFHGNSKKIGGIRTTASSRRAHDCLGDSSTRRGMLVCRVIAGRVKSAAESSEDDEEASPAGGSYDSVAGCEGLYGICSSAEELYIFNARAILVCFVVIYSAVEN